MSSSMNKKIVLIFWFFALFGSGCSNTKYLGKTEVLYTGATFKLISKDDFKISKDFEAEIASVIAPSPNNKILGMRVGLWLYNIVGKPKGKGLRYWLKNKIGEAPVIYDSRYTEKVTELIENRLGNNGHFRSDVIYEEIRSGKDKKKVEVHYKAYIREPYQIDSIFFPDGNTAIEKAIRALKSETLLKPGKPYNLAVLKKERERIEFSLKNQGYYFFNHEDLLFEADTTVAEKSKKIRTDLQQLEDNTDTLKTYHSKVHLYLRLKNNLPQKNLKAYHIDQLYIYPHYELGRADSLMNPDSTVLKEFTIISRKNRKNRFKPGVFSRSIFLEEDSLYTQNKHQNTLSRFSGLNTFKFINVDIQHAPNKDSSLDAHIFLTPMPGKTLQAELIASTQSNGFAGPELNIKVINRNLFQGAEHFSLQLEGGFQKQFSKQNNIDLIWWTGISGELSFPYLLIPFHIKKHDKQSAFYTKILPSYRRINFEPFLLSNSLGLDLGYEWKKNKGKQHRFYPFALLYQNSTFKQSTISDEISKHLAGKSLSEQFILASHYEYTYNDLLIREKNNNFYFQGSIETSGNILSLFHKIAKNKEEKPPYKLFNVPFSQYLRLGTEFRYYHHITSGTKIVSRLIANLGIPYGNSQILPFFKQYFIGGPNSIRAFTVRSVGPGLYQPPDSLLASSFIRQSGDIKLEGNIEYRFDIFSFLKGAVFMDAGNVWLLNKDDDRPGGEFKSNSFLKQIAVGTGAGLRVDISFLVIRFDFGMPLRKPDGWVIKDIDFSNKDWRRKNIIFNLAIGYPF